MQARLDRLGLRIDGLDRPAEREMKGNAIDFLMLVECHSFHEAMEILTRED